MKSALYPLYELQNLLCPWKNASQDVLLHHDSHGVYRCKNRTYPELLSKLCCAYVLGETWLVTIYSLVYNFLRVTFLIPSLVCSFPTTHSIHCSGAGRLQCGSIPGDSSIDYCGIVKEEQWDELYGNLVEALYGACKRRGDERSAASGRQGLQHTPAMITALMFDAIDRLGVTGPQGSLSTSHISRGGFTDVGLHTGGRPRETAWFLACEMFKVGSLPERMTSSTSRFRCDSRRHMRVN